MKIELKNKLDQLIGGSFIHLGKTITINSYKQLDNSLIILKTNIKTFNFYTTEIDSFLKGLTPVLETLPNNSLNKGDQLPSSNLIPGKIEIFKSETHIKLETSLNNMIDKVMDDKKHVPQARALCDIANTMINLEKQQINFLKSTNQL